MPDNVTEPVANATNADLAAETERRKAEKAKKKAEEQAKKQQEKEEKLHNKYLKTPAKKRKELIESGKITGRELEILKEADTKATEKEEKEAKEKELSGKSRNAFQELKHEVKKNIFGTEGFDEQDTQQEYNKYYEMTPEKRQKLIDSGKITGQKLDILKQAHADAATGEKKMVDKKVINASTGEKMSLEDSKSIIEEKSNDAAPPSDNGLTYAQVLEKNDGDKEKVEQWLIDHPGYEIGEITVKELGPESIARVKQARAAKAALVKGIEGDISAKADALGQDLENKNAEYADRMSKRIAEFEKDVDDKYIEGLPKGIWRQYKSDTFGLSTDTALKKLQSLGLSEKEAKEALKKPKTEEQKKIADANKDAKSTLGYFVLDTVANGLSNASKAVRGQDIDTNAGMAKQMQLTNLEKALERRNQKYGTLQERQWQSLIDSTDLTNEQRKVLNDVKVSSAFTKQLNQLDIETKKEALELMAKWDFSPKQIARVIAAKEMLSDDPEALDTVIASMSSDLMNNDGSINEDKVKDLAELLGTSVSNIMAGLGAGIGNAIMGRR